MARLAVLEITNGIHRGKKTVLKAGTCKVIGRTLDEEKDNDMTGILTRDIELVLEDTNVKKANEILSKSMKKREAKEKAKAKIDNPYKRTMDFIVTDPNISRVHSMIFNGEEIAGIIDLASTNGTFVDGVRIDTAELKGGELITVGNTELNFRFQEES